MTDEAKIMLPRLAVRLTREAVLRHHWRAAAHISQPHTQEYR